MSMSEEILNSIRQAKRNPFWKPWAIITSPKTIEKIKTEFVKPKFQEVVMDGELMTMEMFHNGPITEILGLKVIPYDVIKEDHAIIVNEEDGRRILELIGGKK